MNILHADGLATFAQVSLELVKERLPNFDGTVVHVQNYAQAVEKLTLSHFDLVVSAVRYPGAAVGKGLAPPHLGGVELYLFVTERNKRIEAGDDTAFCFLSSLEPYKLPAVLKKYGGVDEVPSNIRIYDRGKHLDEIIAEFVKDRASGKAGRPVKKRNTGHAHELAK